MKSVVTHFEVCFLPQVRLAKERRCEVFHQPDLLLSPTSQAGEKLRSDVLSPARLGVSNLVICVNPFMGVNVLSLFS